MIRAYTWVRSVYSMPCHVAQEQVRAMLRHLAEAEAEQQYTVVS